ncbi:DEAD/DEAH box helicase [Acidobacteria bacterium AH-259-L09]|nr:DEAD/DEAH box helicase [Acidobacteria bacterium AH-259-L09]
MSDRKSILPKKRGRAASKALERKPVFRGWKTTDEEEIERRRLRASIEPIIVERLEPQQPFYGTYRTRSKVGDRSYLVEICSLRDLNNSCECPDYRVNGLGTCKHIEAVLTGLRQGRVRLFARAARDGSPRIEVFLSSGVTQQVRVAWSAQASARARKLLAPFFSTSDVLLADPIKAIPTIKRSLADAPDGVRPEIRLARDVEAWVSVLRRRDERLRAKEDFMRDVEAGKRSLDFLKYPLYPYQQKGMLHLAFAERVLLADDMGLGKTVQAIAACELLRQIRNIERVLVVCPVSLKAEWEEQIAKFTGLRSRAIWGPRAQRLKLYRQSSFFYLTNYEQIRSDVDEISQIIAPDVIILDEAQRIKNWQTKTAKAVKRLSSPYAFVLTGTPLENRIDEIYSIVEFLDPQLLGPLFRFNRDFYDLDERGRPQGYKNLDQLRRRIRPLMLRRRKDEVEDQLPGRILNNYFVTMESEQQVRYDEYSTRVARLLAITRRRPLTREEGEKLQKWLACMRMICDSPFILDMDCRICPKLSELESVLEDLLQSDGSKVLVFSEWERMLQLVRQLAEEMGLGFAWHTGSVPQKKRRQEINRFKSDPGCRLFLSTDSGSTGLNLQVANVVVNLDLPWNPAKLEQRIARAWRKYQTKTVSVVNLICENSIEHRMLGLLAQKQQLADGVLDGRGDLKSMQLPSGRAAFIERLEALMGMDLQKVAAPTGERLEPTRPLVTDPYEVFGDNMVARLADRLLLLDSRENSEGHTTLLAVVDGQAEQFRPLTEKLLRESFAAANSPANERPLLELVDRTTYETIQRLIDSGLLKANTESVRQIHRSSAFSTTDSRVNEQRRKEAQKIFSQADRKMRMAALLADGGFAIEAVPPLCEAIDSALKALACLEGEEITMPEGEVSLNFIQSRLVSRGKLSDDALSVVARMHQSAREAGELDENGAQDLIKSAKPVFDHVHVTMNKAALS